jgi:hypothetical protein
MCIGINVPETMKFVQGFYNRIVGFKASTEENLFRKKDVLQYYKNRSISHWLFNMATTGGPTNV